MSLFGGGSSTNAAQTPTYTQMQLQSSVYGVVVPVVYGATRVGWNLGDYVNFQQISTPNASSSSGGKGGIVGGGGGKGGSSGNTISYTASLLGILGEGPMTGVASSWVSQTQNAGTPGFDFFAGSIAQTPWLYLTDNYLSHALTYSGISYMAAENYDLGSSANMPNINWELQALLYNTAPGTYGGGGCLSGGDADPSLVVPDILTNTQYGSGFPVNRVGQVVSNDETHTVPNTPFQVTVTNAVNFLFNVNVVIAGVSLTCVASSPGANQYSYTSAGVYTFNSAQAAASAKIRYGSISVLTNYQNFCIASGIWISPAYTDQSDVSTIINDIALATFSEVVWSCGVLQMIPRGTQAITANGKNYVPNTTPLFNLGIDDFMPNTNPIGSASISTDDPVIISRSRASDQINVIKIEALDRANQYAPAVVEASDQGLVQKFGRRGNAPKSLHMFCDLNAANVSAQLQLQDEYLRNTYSFQLDERYCMLDPMDLLTLTDPNIPGLTNQAVRPLQITENDDGTLSFAAEEVPGNIGTVPAFNLNPGGGTVPDFNVDPGDVAPPAIFDVPVQLAQVIGLETWIGISSVNNNPNWGGCDVYLSTDNATYVKIGTQTGPSRMGVLTATFASGSDPDTVNTLSVNLTISGGELQAGTLSDANNGTTLCFVDGEYVSYEQCTLTSTNHYNLGKNGGTAGLLRRGQWGSSITSHASGSLFVRLDDGVFKIPYSKTDQGRTIWIKFVSFNIYEGGYQPISGVTAYSHVIGGPPAIYAPTGLSVNPTLKGLQLNWTNAPNVGIAAIEIWRSATSSFGAATHIADAGGYDTAYIDQTVASGQQYWYWIRPRDISGNEGQYDPSSGGAGASNTPAQVATVDLGTAVVTGPKIAAGAIDSLKFAAGIVPVQVVTSLPGTANEGDVAVLTTDGKLYRYHSGQWTVAVDGSDLTDFSVIGSKIAIADTTNIIPNSQFIDGNGGPSIGGWVSITGGGLTAVSGVFGGIAANPPYAGHQTGRDCFAVHGGVNGFFPVNPGETYYVDCSDSFNPSTRSFGGGLQTVNASYTSVAFLQAWTTGPGLNGQKSGQVTIPAGSVYARFWSGLDVISGLDPSGAYICLPRVRKASSSELLVDGSITASKMTVNSIVAGTIAVGAINATALIVNNILITGQLVNNAVTNSAATFLSAGNNVSIGLSTAGGAVIVTAGGQIVGSTNQSIVLQNLTTGQVFAAYTIGPNLGSFCLIGYDTSAGTGINTYQVVDVSGGVMNVTLYALEVKR